MTSVFSPFADTIRLQKYAHTKQDGTKETWEETSYRVAKNVLRSVGASKSQIDETARLISERKFIPGGRYLYASGKPFHQVQNCFEGSTRVVTRNGVKPIKDLILETPILMTAKGDWVKADVRSFGEQQLYKVILSRLGIQKEIFATASHSWRIAKNTTNGRPGNKISKTTIELEPNDKMWQVFGFGISRTPVSPMGVQHGIVYGDGNVPKDEFGFNTANVRLCGEKDAQLLNYFYGYTAKPIENDIEISGLPRKFKTLPSLTDDRSYLFGWLAGYFAADGCVSEEGKASLASSDKASLEFAREVCYILGIGTYSIGERERISNLTENTHVMYDFCFMRDTLTPEFFLIKKHRERFEHAGKSKRRSFWNVISIEPTDRVEEVYCAVVPDTHEFVLEDNILTGNCLLLKVEDSREGWSDLLQKASMALMTGAGIGVDYSAIRKEGSKIRKTGGVATGPIALMGALNEVGRAIRQGGDRRSAIWAGLNWQHADIHKFITMKNWIPEVRALKEKDFNFPAMMDGTNISVLLDDEFFKAFHNERHKLHVHAQSVYWATVKQMLKTAEPGFSIDIGENTGETLRNACTEVCSRDDSDICNLGSINLARIQTLDEMKHILDFGTAFLVAGTVYSDVPYAKVDMIRTKNRRLGLGLMGVHEWLLTHGYKYEPCKALEEYLEIYATSTEVSHKWADKWELSRPVKTRAMAPNGTIGIVGETSTSLEPVLCVAYRRRYAKGSSWNYQYVVDPTAKRLIDAGVNPDHIEDAYVLAENVERRVAFQAWFQKYVDHGISSTINLPQWGSELNNDGTVQDFGNMLIKYLPELRGITCYPDGARGGQPLSAVKYSTAIKHIGEIFEETLDICDISKGGTCG